MKNLKIILIALFCIGLLPKVLAQVPGTPYIVPTATPAPVPPVPVNMTLNVVCPYLIYSVNDNNYLPYTEPVSAGNFTSPSNPDGTTEALIDIQGTLTTAGITINIPYTVSFGTVNLLAYSQIINVPASSTQDGNARDVEFSWAAGTYATGSGYIPVTVKALVGNLSIKKLDINTGVGSDALGALLAQFSYPINNSNTTNTFDLRAVAAIPDGNEDANHRMVYFPIISNLNFCKVWLNNNLGADYANTAHTSFSPAKQAENNQNDHHAYGSLFQGGRYSDGHELIIWANSTTGTRVNGFTTILSPDATPDNSLIIGNSYGNVYQTNTGGDWSTVDDVLIWNSPAYTNNPCPKGFIVADDGVEYNAEMISNNIFDMPTAYASFLKLTAPGTYETNTDLNGEDGEDFTPPPLPSGNFSNVGTHGYYWSRSSNGNHSQFFITFEPGSIEYGNAERTIPKAVRCVKK